MNIALIYGGRSAEHEVSINSAKGVYAPLCNLGHSIHLIAITLEGKWYLQKKREVTRSIETEYPLSIIPGIGLFCNEELLPLDAAFAVTHGFGGEDGNLQGLCMLANLPLCGCDTLSSAIGMHKDVSAKLFALEGIPTVPSQLLDRHALQWLQGQASTPPLWLLNRTAKTRKKDAIKGRWAQAWLALQGTLGPKLFIKPENSGSSLGVSALRTPDEATFREAVLQAQKHSEAVLVQALIEPMDELECALLETADGKLIAAGPALVVDPGKESNHFLSYAYKYAQVDSAYLKIPSSYSLEIEDQIRDFAKRAFRAIRAEGYARIDFFVSGDKVFLNEINTSPGMTSTSHFPLLMHHSGYPMEKVLETLIDGALQRKKEELVRIYRPPEA